MYTLTIFSNLIQQYPSFEELQAFLSSEEGGKLRIIMNETQKRYVIMRYVKGQSHLTDSSKPWVPWFRSVVWDTETNRPVCVAPRKAMFSEIPSNQSTTIEEFVEGVMVNGFIGDSSEMILATRSKIGATTGYWTTKTFAEMMEEAQRNYSLNQGEIAEALKSNHFTFGSFVIQHPEHRVVQKNTLAKLYCIHLGSVNEKGEVTIHETKEEWPESLHKFAVKSFGVLPAGKSAVDMVNNSMNAWAMTWQGFVFRGQQGERWRYRTKAYTSLRELRGNESKVEERFVRLRSTGKIGLYLKNWNEDKQSFSMLEAKFRNLTKEIYYEYCNIHKAHSKTIHDVNSTFKGMLYYFPGIDPNQLPAKNATLQLQTVIHYGNTLLFDVKSSILLQDF